MNRREFMQFLLAGYAAGIVKPSMSSSSINYHIKPFGDIRLIHITDTHAQLEPMYFREPNYNLGVGVNRNKPPHIIGRKLLDYYSMMMTESVQTDVGPRAPSTAQDGHGSTTPFQKTNILPLSVPLRVHLVRGRRRRPRGLGSPH